MQIFEKIKNAFLYTGLSKKEFKEVKELSDLTNAKSLIYWSISAIVFWSFSIVMSLNSKAYLDCIYVYFVALVIAIITLLFSLFVINRIKWLLFPTFIVFELSLIGSGIGIAICQPDVRTVTMIVMAVICPICFIERTIVYVIIQIFSVVLYITIGNNVIVPEVYSWGLLNLLIFSLVGLSIGHVINRTRYQRLVYYDVEKKLKEIQNNYNSNLKKEVEEKTNRIYNLHDKLVLGIATLIESRDNSTGGHIKRTSKGVEILINEIIKDEELHLSDEFCRKVIKAAPMHDLGKITIDDDILRKPGKYDEQEYNIMKTHTIEGAKIVSQILSDVDDEEFKIIAENVAHYHHEFYNGNGYPCGLKGEEIPIEARIMAIADVYDALVSKRTYKEKYSFEDANQIILDEMGTHFDPNLKKYYILATPHLEEYYSSINAE